MAARLPQQNIAKLSDVISPGSVRSLLHADAYDHPAPDARIIQTHISWVLLAGEFAYKIKKPVRLGFLDYSTLPLRKEMCEREVRLNRRTCSDAYLGVVPVVERDRRLYFYGAGNIVEYAVKMRRFAEEGWLSSRIERGDATPALARRIAESVHAFHVAAESGAGVAAFGSHDAVRALWEQNLEEIAPFAGDTIRPELLHAITRYGHRFLEANRALIDQRASSGRARDCHGDLRADAIHIGAERQICMTDCIEFSDRFRCGDIAGDVAFLAMDLDFRRREHLSDEFAGRYAELSAGDETLPHVAPFYRCYRAAVRGKVESITAREPEVGSDQARAARDRAVRYFAWAARYAADSRPQALLIAGGLSGSGKSHLAAALAMRIGAVLVRTDAVRREIAPAPDDPMAAVAYGPEDRARVYARARERVRSHLQAGRTVILDATHIELRERDAARALAAECGAPAILVWVNAGDDVIRARLKARETAPDALSDARWETYLRQRQAMDPLTDDERRDAVVLDGAAPANANIAAVRARLTRASGQADAAHGRSTH